jgi:hypothetical protein
VTDQTEFPPPPKSQIALFYHVLRFTPNLVRDEWINIGILLFNPATGERRLRLIEDETEFRRLRRMLPQVSERLVRALQNDLEDRLESAAFTPLTSDPYTAHPDHPARVLEKILEKWDSTLSNALQLATQKGVFATDIDAEMDRLFADHVAVPYVPGLVGSSNGRARIRSYCSQVFRQARLWDRIEKSVRVDQWTIPDDPFRIDYSYLRNGTRGFVHALSVSRGPGDFKPLAYTAELIRKKEKLATEFAAVTDVGLIRGKRRDDYISTALREAGIEPIPMEGLAVWVAKLKPLLLQ